MVSSGEDQLLLFVTEKNAGFFFFSRGIFSEFIFASLSEWIISGYINLPGLIRPATFSSQRQQFRITDLKLAEVWLKSGPCA